MVGIVTARYSVVTGDFAWLVHACRWCITARRGLRHLEWLDGSRRFETTERGHNV
jgi:hypothetical protein